MKHLMHKLTNPMALAGGDYTEMVEVLKEVMPDKMLLHIDHAGNAIFTPHGPTKPTTYLTAHMDEIGIMISKKDGDCYKFTNIGGIDARILPGSTFKFENGTMGVIGMPAPHIAKKRGTVVPIDKLRIETFGAKLSVGDVGVFDTKAAYLNGSFVSRNVDNRAGCAILVKVAEKMIPNVGYVFLVNEEIGLKGATAFFNKHPEVEKVINVDVCLETDLGKGCYVELKDGAYIINKELKEAFKACGAERFCVGTGGTSDHAVAMLHCKTAAIALPSKFIHSGIGAVHLDDLKDAVKLIVKALRRL